MAVLNRALDIVFVICEEVFNVLFVERVSGGVALLSRAVGLGIIDLEGACQSGSQC